MSEKTESRRSFLKQSAAATIAASQFASVAPAKAYQSNDRLRIGIIGPGRRGFGSHVKTLVKLRNQKGANLDITGINDVYTVHRDQAVNYIKQETGQTPKTYQDYRDLLNDKEIDAVCIATPDHWHAKQVLDALEAGKHVYCEKPMTHHISEAFDVVDAWKKSGLVVQVGVQSTSIPIWNEVRALVDEGKLGKIVQFQAESFRNSLGGMSRHNVITKEMTPQSVDWKRWLGVEEGLAPDLPFDRATFGQWRCYWPFGYGMYSDLFVHRVSAMLKATGLKYPGRVVGGGGIFLEYDDREVTDVASIIADFHEGVQGLISSTMVSSAVPIRHLIRGHHGTVVFDKNVFGQRQAYEFIPERPQVTLDSKLKQEEVVSERVPDQTLLHFENFLAAVKAGDPTLVNNTPELGAAAVMVVNLAVQSYREGKVFQVERDTLQINKGDSSWADNWEKMSKSHSKPRHVAGWHAGDRGSLLVPPQYQKLAGPWIDGKPPENT
ncbi:Gfo/Idh/MocA family oxidoreductase [Gimesia sp.]|uniref:Gfo/Idh/MocA family protein n=1 Tax=Gimesia sp. TaxID=2024833 RepID=UPI000C3DAB88|nr:Gfo/Idh/MocA family oxidoreductase [Gimesia sp.]MAX37842.1 oxidoreductase [Gimesia sp.]HBL43282.1 oxidoreductase [Planctomycetaceae bacterium]|tara:strand:+ start:21842 stop:23320 length:1479 start_codon:yes stop_codon:yes gene_type:complete